MLSNKKNNKKRNNLLGLFFIGLIFVISFFIGGNVSLLKQNIISWPKARAKVSSIESKIVCETPERSGACYNLFFINYSYDINGKKYTSQMEQMYSTNYSVGQEFDVYYKEDNPEFAFAKEEIPTRLNLYMLLIIGLTIIISVIILWIHNHINNK